ncbi:MAG: cytochrome c3 family protein [Burkholderiales bacterium]
MADRRPRLDGASSLLVRCAALTLLGVAIVAAIVYALRPDYRSVRTGRVDQDYLTSQDCKRCHEDRHASWARTYHGRMTQEARVGTVQGDFTRDNTLEYMGVKATMSVRDGRHAMSLALPDGRTLDYSIDRTVGSRRIEQYLTREAGQYTRLPLAYDLVNRRWMSLNGSFFHPDGSNYFRHLTQWNSNCVFCHNVKAQPHMDFATGTFRTEVSELGIACGACHGKAARHAELATSPFNRYAWHLGSDARGEVVSPSKLPDERALMVCGRCHGQRIPEPMGRIRSLMTDGDPFDAGDDLSRYYTPVTHTTVLQSPRGDVSFASRFWANGSPRLSAYEYQGIRRSACFVKGKAGERVTCLNCHTPHAGDPRGLITEENRGDAPCIKCHETLRASGAREAHGKHASGAGSPRCYDCHMPKVVYGVMTFHPTHDITVPAPQSTATQGVPNACNQCHLDKSVNWAIRETRRLWPQRYKDNAPSADAVFDLAEGPRGLFMGDAITRALAAFALGGGGPAKPDPAWAAPYLVEALTDNYPIVRYFAANGLMASGMPAKGGALPKPDYLGTPSARDAAAAAWRQAIDAKGVAQSRQLAEAVRKRRNDVDLEVGE